MSLTVTAKVLLPRFAKVGVQEKVADWNGDPLVVKVAPGIPLFHTKVVVCPLFGSLLLMVKLTGVPAHTVRLNDPVPLIPEAVGAVLPVHARTTNCTSRVTAPISTPLRNSRTR